MSENMDHLGPETTRMDCYPESEVIFAPRRCRLSNKSMLEAGIIVWGLGPGHRGAGPGPRGQHVTRALGLHTEHEGDPAAPIRPELVHHHLTRLGVGHVVILAVDRAIV